MRIVVKLAGALLEERRALDSIAAQITQLASGGHELLVVHGGGRIFTSTLARMGVTSRFVDGLRVTDAETREAAIMVFAGLLNRRVTASISRAGVPAVGICGADGSCFSARTFDSHGGPRGLGYVGRLEAVNLDFLASLWRAGIVPVSPCLAADRDGEIYNINADQMASAAAVCIHAHKLVFLTDVPGVLEGGEVKPSLDCCEIEDRIRTGFVSGGMILKLRAATQALNAGVSSVRIVGGSIPGALLVTTCQRADPGTRIVRAPAAPAAATGASTSASRGCP